MNGLAALAYHSTTPNPLTYLKALAKAFYEATSHDTWLKHFMKLHRMTFKKLLFLMHKHLPKTFMMNQLMHLH